ncbi:MAG: Do family serine endopeptidase [Spirochaetota bacterium]
MNKEYVKISSAAVISLILLLPAFLMRADSLQRLNSDMQQVAGRVLPTVVSISSEKPVGGNRGFGLPFDNPRTARALGSGVIIDKRGYIVTNYHVIKDASNITVTLSDNREFKSKVIGEDPATDLAVIQISDTVPSSLPVITFADSDRIRPGQIAIAVGNSFGFSNTITMGIVSAVNRENLGLLDYESLIQTDAAINPGNSGGALVNIDGQLIGINTAIYSRSGGNDGLGFAIPSNQVTKVSTELIKKGKVVRGWIGVLIQNLNEDLAKRMKLSVTDGVLITDVESGSPAMKAGLKTNDVIVSINKRSVKDVNSLRKEVADMKPGATVDFGIIRDENRRNIAVRVGTMPEKTLSRAVEVPDRDFGIAVTAIDEETSYRYGVTDRNGVIVREIRDGSPAHRAGFLTGDVIKAMEEEPVRGVTDYHNLLDRYIAHRVVKVLVHRRDSPEYVTIRR